MADERAERVGKNEVLYRSINERIEDLNLAFGAITDTMSVVCECGKAGCTEQIEVDIGTYERIRADPTLFIVVKGHEIPDVEPVAEEHEGFNVVRKQGGEPERLAREHDPRS